MRNFLLLASSFLFLVPQPARADLFNTNNSKGDGAPETSINSRTSDFGLILPIGMPISLGDSTTAIFIDDTASLSSLTKSKNGKKKRIYKLSLMEEIGPPALRQTQAAFRQAQEMHADYILIHLNTYGGAIDAADKIRTKILKNKTPVIVYIDNNAASAGAMISLACDSIYMSRGASIGAATAVDQNGQPLSEKVQSYVRSQLRSTAEASGRDPKIAEAMNDSRIRIPGVNDSGKVVSFTTSEAVTNGFCEAQAESIDDVLNRIAGAGNYEVIEYQKSSIESVIDLLLNPFISGILIMIIIGGIYFELQTPGVGFPLFAAITAAILYFAPLYLEGLAENWEILLFVTGVILVLVEIFVVPGFGITGISGIVAIVLGLALSLVDSVPSDSPVPVSLPEPGGFLKAFLTVVLSVAVSLGLSVWLGAKFLRTRLFGKIILDTSQSSFSDDVLHDKEGGGLIGKTGTAFTVMKPSGKVEINGEVYDASADLGYIEKGEAIQVIKLESTRLFVRKAANA